MCAQGLDPRMNGPWQRLGSGQAHKRGFGRTDTHFIPTALSSRGLIWGVTLLVPSPAGRGSGNARGQPTTITISGNSPERFKQVSRGVFEARFRRRLLEP